MQTLEAPVQVSLIAIPDAVVSTLSGVYDVLSFAPPALHGEPAAPGPRFRVEIVGERAGPVRLASGLSVEANRGIADIPRSDIVIVPSLLLGESGWKPDRYPALVTWLSAMHERGAVLCSACSGIFLLAETALFDGQATTVHWGYESAFRRAFPQVPCSPERVLIAAGRRGELITSGASASWHDLVLYLIARYIGPTAAQSTAKFFALQWHRDGLAPYIVFAPPADHGDALVAEVQTWLETHFSLGSPVDEMVRRSGLPERTFKRRFVKATGYTPIEYVQRLRIEDAKRRLERTEAPTDEIGWKVGYEDPAFFRRLFKRITGITPAAYRRKFRLPDWETASMPRRGAPMVR
jgi:transcriptional regulator GlxA family with amidase domain